MQTGIVIVIIIIAIICGIWMIVQRFRQSDNPCSACTECPFKEPIDKIDKKHCILKEKKKKKIW